MPLLTLLVLLVLNKHNYLCQNRYLYWGGAIFNKKTVTYTV